jgi:hypothetical protein
MVYCSTLDERSVNSASSEVYVYYMQQFKDRYFYGVTINHIYHVSYSNY